MEFKWKSTLVLSTLIVLMKRCESEVGFHGERVSLGCRSGLAQPMYWWFGPWNSTDVVVNNENILASYTNNIAVSETNPRVQEPWHKRHWNISLPKGDLTIPEVLLSDENVYYCGVSSSPSDIPDQVRLDVYVRPTLFTMEKVTPMPVETNSSISATCTANEIRPEPMEFYWVLGEQKIVFTYSTITVNTTYNVLQVSSTIHHTVVEEDDGKTLACVLVMANGDPISSTPQSLQIDVIGVGPSASSGNILIPAAIGGALGAVLLIIIIAGICCYCKRKKSGSKANGSVKISANAMDEGVQYAAVNKPRPANRPAPPPEPEYIYTKAQPPPVPAYNGGSEFQNNNELQTQQPEVNYAELDRKLLNTNRYKQGPPKPPRITDTGTEYAAIDHNKQAPPQGVHYEDENLYNN